jgi:cytochrome c-type biogenesis protein CcmH/NrfG
MCLKNWLSFILALTVLSTIPARAQQRELTHEPSGAERRIALVIGNSAYKIGPLRNPINDARAVARVLTDLGFNVIRRENLSQKEMERAIRDFGAKLTSDDVGLFYYAGHGVQINGENYLVPVDVAPESAEELEDSAVKVSNVLRRMERASGGMNIMILDACRNNPFTRSFRSVSDGLAKMDANEHSMDTFIAFAADAGKVASDGGTSGNGVFTQELLRHIRTPGLSIDQVFTRVTAAVLTRTQNKQRPWVSRSLTRDFSFVPPINSSPEKITTPAVPAEAASSSRAMARDLYNSGYASEFTGTWAWEKDYSKAATLYREAVKLDPTNALYQNALGKALVNDYEQKYSKWDSDREKEEMRIGQINQENLEKSWPRTVYLPPTLPGGPPRTIYVPGKPISTVASPFTGFPLALSAEAIPALREAVRLEPENAAYRSELINAWYKYGVEPPSVKEADTKDVFGLSTRSTLPKIFSQQTKAEKEADVREVLSLEPNNPKLHGVLAAVLIEKGKLADAEAEYREAIRLEPQTVYYHSRLAELLVRQQKWAEAVEEYRQAVLLAPNDKALKKSLQEAVKNQKRYKR